MFARIVMTSGTSIFAPFNELASKLSDVRGFQIDRGKARAREGLDPRQAVEYWTQSIGQLALPTSLDPTKVSAEYSLVHALREQHKPASHPHVVLIRSDTPGGAAAAIPNCRAAWLLHNPYEREAQAAWLQAAPAYWQEKSAEAHAHN